MTLTSDNELCARGAATLVASWEEDARGSAGAALERLDGVAAAVFPSEPERTVYNNALLDRDLGRSERAAAADAMAAAYGSAGIDRYAAWVHESDEGMRAELSGRGYTIAESHPGDGIVVQAVMRAFCVMAYRLTTGEEVAQENITVALLASPDAAHVPKAAEHLGSCLSVRYDAAHADR